MKAVLISIKPEWCNLIAEGKKTLEVRKTRPKLDTPFKVYIYETRAKCDRPIMLDFGALDFHGRGQVIGEFVCDKISKFKSEFWDDETDEIIKEVYEPKEFAEEDEYGFKTIATNEDKNYKENRLCKESCVSWEELRNYVGQDINVFYGWHISQLKIYDEPKELGEFIKAGILNFDEWLYGIYNGKGSDTTCYYDSYLIRFRLKRPPQSWRYVEERDLR